MNKKKNNEYVLANVNIEQTEFLNSNNIEKVSGNNLLNYALHYAKIGYPVLPLHNVIVKNDFKRCSCSEGINCTKPGKHPRTRRGHKNATTDRDLILKWWDWYPNANIGLLTGIKTGIFVLDIDIKHNGEHSLEELKDCYKDKLKDKYDCEETLTAYTGSGGRHLIYKHPMDFKIKSSESIIDSGLDIKGEESYIVAAPSNHWSGGIYSWHGINTAITEAPNWLIYEVVRSQEKPVISRINSPKEAINKRISVGERNSYLSCQARGLVNSFSEKDGLKILLKKNKENFNESLPEKEVEGIAKKTWKRFGKNQNLEMELKK